MDVASGGELHMALRAGFDPGRVYLHGNNKTEAELRYAAEAGVGHVILDSFAEIERLDAMLDRPQDVLIRVTPGILPSTHSYVQTGGLDSKFGFGLEDGLAARAIAEVLGSRNLRLVGLHAHIGSQIFELEPYAAAIEALAALVDGEWECRILNVGGGLGIAYTAEDEPPSIDAYVDVKVRGVQRVFDPVPADPDRAGPLAGRQRRGHRLRDRHGQGDPRRADLPLGRRRDVGQPAADALRLPLRGDRREPRRRDARRPLATVAGMHCESGDILITDALLADPGPGDILVTPATGAYGYAMASNYNGVPRPAGRLLQGRRRAGGRATRDVGRPGGAAMSTEAARIGLLGVGTVGSAFRDLVSSAPEAIAASPAAGRRSPGSFAAPRATSTRSSRTPRSSSS